LAPVKSAVRHKPIAYDFNPCFDVASIDELSSEQLSRYKQHNLDGLRTLIGGALARLQDTGGLVDWFDYCTRLSEAAARLQSRANQV